MRQSELVEFSRRHRLTVVARVGPFAELES